MTGQSQQTYSARRALLDSGQLLDVTRIARANRIIIPTALTLHAWKACGGKVADVGTARGDQLATRILAAARSQAVHSNPAALAAATLGFAVEDHTGRIVEARAPGRSR